MDPYHRRRPLPSHFHTPFSHYHLQVMDPYYRRRPLPSPKWNLWANNNEGWDELERRSRFFFNR